ncbi:MAG: NTP transferase domain-containing protein [Deltaproteobacteria bacterium]|nr:NTP transferase domain-containing protein [Deltaproteobacteria bacterium]
MNELERIVREAAVLSAAESPYLLATVVRVSGSSYRRPGARMLVAGDRWLAGCVSGGCLEGDVMLRGAHRAREGAVVVTYDSQTDDGEPYGLGCGGIVDVLLEYVAPGARHDAIAFASACFAAEATGTLVTVIRSSDKAIPLGARVAVGPRVELAQPVADPAARRALDELARGAPGVYELPALGIAALVEHVAPSPQLFILGSGHDVAPIVPLAKSVGFRVTVADRAVRERSRVLAADRVIATDGDIGRVAELVAAAAESYVVIMHHQVGADRRALAMALASRARYIGVLGPARRTRDLLVELGRDAGERLDEVDPRLHAPIGLDLGAETPEQIALAIVSEIQAVAHRARGGMLRERARSLHADVATIVLAAGGSRRLGRPKQLVELEGVPLVQRAARTAIAARTGPVGIVLGAAREAIAPVLADLRVAQVVNEHWEEGIASSIRAGVRWAQTTQAGALLVVLADQPRLDADHLAALRDAWLAGAPVAASHFGDVVGAPAIFDRARWEQLLTLTGDQGAGKLLRAPDVVAIAWPGGAQDVDTDADVAALR